MIADRNVLVVGEQRVVRPHHPPDVGRVEHRRVEVGVVTDLGRHRHLDVRLRDQARCDQVLPLLGIGVVSVEVVIVIGRAYAAALIANGVPTAYREAVGNIHGFVTLRKAIPSAQVEVDGALAVLKGIVAEATAARA